MMSYIIDHIIINSKPYLRLKLLLVHGRCIDLAPVPIQNLLETRHQNESHLDRLVTKLIFQGTFLELDYAKAISILPYEDP